MRNRIPHTRPPATAVAILAVALLALAWPFHVAAPHCHPSGTPLPCGACASNAALAPGTGPALPGSLPVTPTAVVPAAPHRPLPSACSVDLSRAPPHRHA